MLPKITDLYTVITKKLDTAWNGKEYNDVLNIFFI